MAIRRLEDEAGTPLFERHTRGMHLTAVGETLQPHAILLQREAEQAREEIDAMRGLARGTTRCGAVGSIASLVLPLAVSGVLQKWPDLRVQTIEGVSDRLAEALVQREIDIALSTATPDTEEIIAIEDCRWEDNSYVVAAPDHPLPGKPQITLADTLDGQWATPPPGTAPFEHMQQVSVAYGLGLPNVVVETARSPF